MGYDKHHGQAGTYVAGKDGARQPVSPDKDGFVSIPDGKGGSQKLHRPMTKPHEDGDAPRDAKGERVDRDAAQEKAAAPQPSMPLPAASPPWATPAGETGTGASSAEMTKSKEVK